MSDDTFLTTWVHCQGLGVCGRFDREQFRRIRNAWSAAGMPDDIAAFIIEHANKPVPCSICGEPMTDTLGLHVNCGGDCLTCMAEAYDPDAIYRLNMVKQYMALQPPMQPNEVVYELRQIASIVDTLARLNETQQRRVIAYLNGFYTEQCLDRYEDAEEENEPDDGADELHDERNFPSD